ncbi:glycosyltransferase family 4 protein [uncultured Caulobacter sp.]|jgi:glycosyltransferase involved in cell wall biosynthesis|uniref:glycosyltransferase family 4 protein n=1 Tax=uncultured Caulobacter sp. TaxID=158749 RepID=UPI0026333A74|nr:glycosyltransferase family 4 protein [uncultured Caulobacter sp.]
MKVLVVNNAAPFQRGGAEELADHLVRRLNATPGVQSELVRVPFAWEPAERLIEEMLIAKGLRLYNVDRVIGLKFPAYLIPHPQKVLWLLHQFRQAYDLSEAGQSHLDFDETGLAVKAAIRAADNDCFAQCRKIYCNSPVTQNRLMRFNGVPSEVLYPPLNDGELFTGGEHGDYVFAGGRVAAGKRQHLLIEALALLPRGPRLVIAGPPENEAYAERLRKLVEDLDLKDRVDLRFGFHPREDIARWANGALICAYLPFDEDSVGYVTMEAFAAGKAVLTVSDSGGLLEIVSQETGAVAEPTPTALAEALERLTSDRAKAIALGRAARDLWRDKNVTWEETVRRLLD